MIGGGLRITRRLTGASRVGSMESGEGMRVAILDSAMIAAPRRGLFAGAGLGSVDIGEVGSSSCERSAVVFRFGGRFALGWPSLAAPELDLLLLVVVEGVFVVSSWRAGSLAESDDFPSGTPSFRPSPLPSLPIPRLRAKALEAGLRARDELRRGGLLAEGAVTLGMVGEGMGSGSRVLLDGWNRGNLGEGLGAIWNLRPLMGGFVEVEGDLNSRGLICAGWENGVVDGGDT